MTETLAPVSTKASTQAPSMKTVNVFDGDSGGLLDFSCDAVSPQKTAAFSFPGVCRKLEMRVEEGTKTVGTAKVNDGVGFESFEGDQSSQVERENDEGMTSNSAGGNRN